MRKAFALILAAVTIATVACSGDDSTDDPTPVRSPAAASTAGATAPGASATPDSAATPDADSTPGSAPTPEGTAPTEDIEVQGVVGSVDEAAGIIDFRATGAEQRFSRIELAPGATIETASGSRIDLANIRPSDRVIARGSQGEDEGTLLADEVTVQAVVPGAQPGG